ncbi:hypothetical protein [Glutamicibacter ardleyensis]|uniref:Uncharacterized protein n=1 Tax=Glutamicibacter ardleyensis TaxID=225894 RepID=A0ABQ2DUV3_9MICC|nr:hypothetical protein [Glutamicibacter ardleyensis]GGJ70961.1 hypothetical protein GCM10007173_32270 [Glutamicibacter ardleyensis]
MKKIKKIAVLSAAALALVIGVAANTSQPADTDAGGLWPYKAQVTNPAGGLWPY